MNAHYTEIAKKYIKWIDTLGYSDDALHSFQYRIRHFFLWLEKHQIQNIGFLTNQHLSDYHRYLETCPNKQSKTRLLSTRHINSYIFNVDRLLEFLHQYGMNNLPAPANLRMKTDERVHPFDILTQQEVKTLYNSISNAYIRYSFAERQAKQYELKLIFALFYGCGLRRSEGYKLQVQDIDFTKKTIFVHQGKNYKDRIVPMNDGVFKIVEDYVYNFRKQLKLKHNRLFISQKETLHYKLKHLQSLCDDEAIKQKRLTLHILRHSIATHFLQNGMSIENIALFLGHSSLNTTQIYTHIVNK
jgi:integrase/recombinase XerD